ncbi:MULTISPECIES: hypothetical protein [Aeromonas]|uniref:hypothetical protein n=1 Tax=Aeromonas TaxID=642 RepID=UPI0011188DF2|nr:MULTISPECIES: hypothetical protein [Aeromonas]
MIEQPAPASRPLLPLEYCSIDRAARLLDCEVEDILHWGAEGLITLMVNFDQWTEPVYGNIWSDNAHDYFDEDGVVSLNKHAEYSDLEPFEDDPDCRFARLNGLWCVSYTDIKKSYLGKPLTEVSVYIEVMQEGMINDHDSAYGLIILEDNLNPIYWIYHEELVLLATHIASGEPLRRHRNLTHSHNVIAKKSMLKKHRQPIETTLAAAISIDSRYPEQCQSLASWAKAISCQSAMLFGGEESALSQGYIETLLTLVINTAGREIHLKIDGNGHQDHTRNRVRVLGAAIFLKRKAPEKYTSHKMLVDEIMDRKVYLFDLESQDASPPLSVSGMYTLLRSAERKGIENKQ